MKILRDQYGGGDFRVRVFDPQGQLMRNPIVRVEPKKIDVAPDPQAGMNQMMTVMMAGFKQITEAIAASKPVAAPAGMGVAETISLISALKPMMGNNTPAAPAVDPLDMITKILTLQRELGGLSGGEGKGDDSMTAILMKGMDVFGKPMAEMMAQTQAQKALQVAPMQPDSAAPLAIAAPVPTIEPLPEDSDMSMKISLIKGAILPMAASDADPFPYANMVLDYFGDDEVERYINAPDWQAQLEKLIPEAAQYRPWFEKLRNTAVELLKPEDQPGTVA
jgi:hypothetical protein